MTAEDIWESFVDFYFGFDGLSFWAEDDDNDEDDDAFAAMALALALTPEW